MGRVSQQAASIAALCPCGCGVSLFPGAELGYASQDCLYRLHGTAPPVTPIPRPPPHFIKVGATRPEVEEVAEGENLSPSITPGEIPSPPPPIVFPSEYARDADREERRHKYDILMEYATAEEIAAFQRAMIKQGLMDEPPDDEDEPEAWPQAVSRAQVYWARNQLRKARNGAPVPQSIAALEALANTPLAGLPERAGKKPAPRRTTKKSTKKAKEA